MKKQMKWPAMFAAVLLGMVPPSNALALPSLQESLFNLNGTQYYNDTGVPGLDSSGFDIGTGLGALVLTFSPGAAGAYYFDAYFDHELAVPFFDEFGAVSGAPGAGISWQIDEPGFGDANRLGTIFTNASANALDNSNYIPGTTSNFFGDCGGNSDGAADPTCNNDVAMALGFNFLLTADEQAIITLNASQTQPAGGFYLAQFSPSQSRGVPGEQLFLTGSLDIRPVSSVPEPSSLLLLGVGLSGMGLFRVARRSLRASV